MKAIRKKILELINSKGYVVYEEKLFKKRYSLKADFDPLTQLFYQKLHKDFFFVQIGANDGISFDPIYHLITKEKVNGIALEPIPDIFEQLKKNYASYPNVKLVNKAIHSSEKEMLLYRVDPNKKEYPDWAKGTASFNKNHHRLGPVKETDIIEQKVQCLSLKDLVKEYQIKHIDLLQIDTEGYDYEIIKIIDFTKMAPTIISFEHGMAAGIMSPQQLFEIQQLLFKHKYTVIVGENDAIAYKTSTAKES